MTAEPLIRVRDLHFSWPAGAALAGIDLELGAGEIFGLLGADGAGKSTLLRVLTGQLAAASGSVRVLGREPGDPRLREDVAYMPQGFGLYPDLSVRENLGFFADLHGLAAARAGPRIAELLARTGLAGFEGRRAGKLSGGMMQKLALACALLSSPRAMFLDEPTTGVDPVSRRAFWRLLEGVRAEGVAIVYATANMDEAERCDRVGLLAQGRLDRQGTPLELIARASGTLLSVSGEGVRERRDAIEALEGVRLVFPVGRRLNVWLVCGHSPERFGPQLAAIDQRLSAAAIEPTLHDATLQDLALAQARPARALRAAATAWR
jgi:ABC-2 type transport system ATP-binding protein